MASSSDRLALGAVLFPETIDGNDIPGPVLCKVADPCDILGIAREPIGKMENLFHFGGDSRQLANAVRQMLR